MRIGDNSFTLCCLQPGQKTNRNTKRTCGYTAEGISSTSLSDRDQEIRELRQQVQDLTGVLETSSLTQRQISEHETRADWYSQHWKSWQDGWWHDQRWTQVSAASSWWDDAKLWDSWQDLYRWADPSVCTSRKWDISEPPAFPGFTANCLMWRKAVLRWKMTTDHPVEKLGVKVMNSLDWTVQAFVDARISAEALLQPDAVESILKVLDAKAGWIQEDESKLLLRKALFSVERGKEESLRQYTTRRLAQIEAASTAALFTMPTTTWGTVLKEGARLTKQSEQNLNILLNGSTELDDVARALNMLDVVSQEGIIKTPVKPVVHSFMENGTSTESQLREEETNETNDQSEEEEEELCPTLEETMAASWIAKIGEEDLSETEAVDSFIAMNEQRKRTWAQAQVLKKAARKDRGFFSSRAGVRNRVNVSRQMRQSLRRSPNPMDGDGRPKDLRARLRKENRCFRCKKKGHWKNECPEKQHNRDGTACSSCLFWIDIFSHRR